MQTLADSIIIVAGSMRGASAGLGRQDRVAPEKIADDFAAVAEYLSVVANALDLGDRPVETTRIVDERLVAVLRTIEEHRLLSGAIALRLRRTLRPIRYRTGTILGVLGQTALLLIRPDLGCLPPGKRDQEIDLVRLLPSNERSQLEAKLAHQIRSECAKLRAAALMFGDAAAKISPRAAFPPAYPAADTVTSCGLQVHQENFSLT